MTFKSLQYINITVLVGVTPGHGTKHSDPSWLEWLHGIDDNVYLLLGQHNVKLKICVYNHHALNLRTQKGFSILAKNF